MTRKSQTLTTAAMLLVLAVVVAAQPKPVLTGTASLSGRVTDHRTQQPLEGVSIILRDYERRGSEAKTTTDASGQFTFTRIAAGSYQVLAAHKGYISQQHGAAEVTSSPSTPEGLITVPLGREVANISFQLARGATIRGRITNPEGQPIEGASVSSVMVVGPNQFRYAPSLGIQVNNQSSATGEFALEGLAPGFYHVTAMPSPQKNSRGASEFQPTSYPGAPPAQAQAIRVESDDSINGIDFPLLRSDLRSISGQVIRTESTGRIEGYVVASAVARTLTIEADGAFHAPGLKPGRYTVWVRAATANGFEAAWETVDAFTDVDAVQLAMSSTATIAGRVLTVDGAPLPIEGFRIAAAWTADGRNVDAVARDQAEVAADGTFAIAGVFGDRVIRLIGLPAGWEIDRVFAAPKRDTDPLRLGPGERVEVIIIVARTAIRGRVTDPEGQPLANARVTAIPVIAPEDLVDGGGAASTITTPTGTKDTGEFALRGLADGLYLLEARLMMPRDPRSGLLVPGEPEFRPTYFPGSTREDAVAVRVTRGEAISNITIPLSRNTQFSIAGHVRRRDSPYRIDAHVLAPDSADQAVPLDPDDRFILTGLKPGRYAMWARAPTDTGFEAAWALVDVVAESVELELALAPTATIHGRIVGSDGTRPDLPGVRVAGAWTSGGQDIDVVWRDQAEVDSEGRFQLAGMFGERTLQVIGLPAGWHVERFVQDGQTATTARVAPGVQADVTIVVAPRKPWLLATTTARPAPPARER